MIKDMDRWLEGYAELAGEKFCGADPKQPGTAPPEGLDSLF